MEKHLPIIVKFTVKEEKLEFVKAELIKVLDTTRKEDGCIRYDLHQDIENPNILMFYEIWETVAAWKAHDEMEHIVKLKEAIEGTTVSLEFNKLTHL